MVYFNDCDVTVDNTGILAESASISSSNSLQPFFSLGKKGSVQQSSSGPIRSNFNISYIVKTDSEPNYSIVSYLKDAHNDLSYKTYPISIGGLTGDCYLESYSVKGSSNDFIKANTSYISFLPLSGELKTKNKNNLVKYNDSTYSGMAHFWTLLSEKPDKQVDKLYDFDYNFKATWEPVYVLGKNLPIQVQLHNAEETLNITREIFKEIQFTGEHSADHLDIDKISMKGLSALMGDETKTLSFIITGQKVHNIELDSQLDDFIRIKSTIKRFY